MDTRSLRLFVLASDLLNISAAGRQLGMAPAVASSTLAKLERAVGADLLHRSTRKVSLSSEGEDFLPFAKEIIAQEEAAFVAMGKGAARINGTLRFAAPSTFAQMYIAPILCDFLDAHPDLKLDLRLSDSQFDLIEGSFDLALRNAELADSSLRARKLAEDCRILCASPGYLAKHGMPTTPDDLQHHRLIAFRNQQRRSLKASDGTSSFFDPQAANSRLMVDDGLTLKRATMTGAGISLNSLWSVHQEIEQGVLVHILPDLEGAEATMLWLVYPKANVLSPKVRVFMDFLLNRFGRNPPWAKD